MSKTWKPRRHGNISLTVSGHIALQNTLAVVGTVRAKLKVSTTQSLFLVACCSGRQAFACLGADLKNKSKRWCIVFSVRPGGCPWQTWSSNQVAAQWHDDVKLQRCGFIVYFVFGQNDFNRGNTQTKILHLFILYHADLNSITWKKVKDRIYLYSSVAKFVQALWPRDDTIHHI